MARNGAQMIPTSPSRDSPNFRRVAVLLRASSVTFTAASPWIAQVKRLESSMAALLRLISRHEALQPGEVLRLVLVCGGGYFLRFR